MPYLYPVADKYLSVYNYIVIYRYRQYTIYEVVLLRLQFSINYNQILL